LLSSIAPALDVVAFFTQFADVTRDSVPDEAA
jgi:hypothetical protein